MVIKCTENSIILQKYTIIQLCLTIVILINNTSFTVVSINDTVGYWCCSAGQSWLEGMKTLCVSRKSLTQESAGTQPSP